MGRTRGGGEYEVDAKHQGRAGRKTLAKYSRRGGEKDKKRQSRRQQNLSPRKEPASAPAESDEDTKPAAVSEPQERVTRSTVVTCRSFGKYRKLLYPGFRFCDRCYRWDMGQMKKSAKVDSTRNKCEAKHTSAIFPTERLKTWNPSHQLGMRLTLPQQLEGTIAEFELEEDVELNLLNFCESIDDSDDDSYVECDSDISILDFLDDDCLANMDSIGLDELDFCATMQRCSSLEEERAILRQQIAKYEKSMQAMNETMKKLRENVKSVSKRNANLRKKANRNPANQPTDPKLPLKDHINRHLDIAMSTHVQGRRTAPFGAALADVVFEYREGISYNAIMSKVRDIIRATILNPWKIAAKMDEHGGTMNSSTSAQ